MAVLGPKAPWEVLYSIPHRILAMFLQRGYLARHDTLDSLLSGDEAYIALKDAAKDKPLICCGTPRGNKVIKDEPMPAEGISGYVERSCVMFGLPTGITHYAWRRSAGKYHHKDFNEVQLIFHQGTAVAEALGADNARKFLGHVRTSNAFETAYDQGPESIDVTAVALGREPLPAAEMVRSQL